jgi:hypothetical protein
LAAQENEVIFSVLKSSGDQVPDEVRGRDVTFGEPRKKSPALCEPDRGIDGCFSRKSMNLAILDAEDIALQMEGPNLPTTIGQELVCPNCAFSYLVYVIRRFCLSKNFRTSAILKLAPNGILAS